MTNKHQFHLKCYIKSWISNTLHDVRSHSPQFCVVSMIQRPSPCSIFPSLNTFRPHALFTSSPLQTEHLHTKNRVPIIQTPIIHILNSPPFDKTQGIDIPNAHPNAPDMDRLWTFAFLEPSCRWDVTKGDIDILRFACWVVGKYKTYSPNGGEKWWFTMVESKTWQ